MRRLVRAFCLSHIPHCWKSQVAAQMYGICAYDLGSKDRKFETHRRYFAVPLNKTLYSLVQFRKTNLYSVCGLPSQSAAMVMSRRSSVNTCKQATGFFLSCYNQYFVYVFSLATDNSLSCNREGRMEENDS